MAKITEEIAEKVLMLKCDNEKGIRRLKKSLMKLPFIKAEEDLETDNLEKIVNKIEKKFALHLSYMMRYRDKENEDKVIYSCMVRDSKHNWIVTTHATSIWEGFAKTIFYMYYYVNKQKRQ